MQWFTKDWWKYLFGKRHGELGMFSTAWCRMQGHPHGVLWYSYYSDGPDMHCKDCGDDLG